MKYLIVGAGGIGGTIAAFLGKAGKDVTLIARGEHLRAMQEHGFIFVRDDGEEVVPGVKAVATEDYQDTPDVIFLCTKSYSVSQVAPFINRVSNENTVIIPLLNGIEIGEVIRRDIHQGRVIEGCIYIFARKDGPGRIYLSGTRNIVVFGDTGEQESLKRIAEDAFVPGMRVYCSENIKLDTLRKFTMVGSMAATGLYFTGNMGTIQAGGEARAFFADCVREVMALGEAMGIRFEEDLVTRHLEVVDNSAPEADTSVQRDFVAAVEAGRDVMTCTELDIFVNRPLELAEKYGVPMPQFAKVKEKLKNFM